MRLSELFASNGAPKISFELFPPRTEKAEASLGRVVPKLVDLDPAYMTVTYGALGSTQDKTLGIASKLRNEFNMVTASHFTCVGATKEEIDQTLDLILAEGIDNIVALRGDPPEGEETFTAPEGGFAHANELVAHIRGRDQFGIAVAGYPEKHVEAPSMDSDLAFLKQKVDAGADVVVTQLFYDNADFFRFVEQAQNVGVDVPIVPGLLPILSYQQIKKITSLCGARIPDELGAQLDAAGDDKEKVFEVGVSWCEAQAVELLEQGVPGIHFYVLNRAKHMERIMSSLRQASLV
ncbi:MAG: methylenetetrahydrofolate reductase [NAD(P)H] [Planctomycetota bacterium]